ncbi:MAG TPA: hypothetical protein VIY48_05595 [Candidatus Paceibacterota bacterium]
MAQPSFDALMYGIGVQESGGSNYSVVNSIGAVGKYQVMKANIPSWSKKVLGHSITWQKFRDSPDLQEKIVGGILRGYYNKYGAKGAASMWYSGQPNPNKSYGNPPVSTYVNSVINHASGYSGQTYSGTGQGGDPVVPKLDERELAEKYGFTMSFLNSNPELKTKFQQMVEEGWSQQMFNARVRETKWWKTHSDKERQYLTQMFTDPATAKQSLSQAQITVRQIANQLGIKETKLTKGKMSEVAYNMVAKGWNEGQLRYYLGQYVYFDGGDMEGQGADVQSELRGYAYSMGVKMSDSWYASQTRTVLRGLATTSDLKNVMLRQAKAMFPQYSKQLDGGQTVADIAQPYLQSMSQILELPQGSINLYDNTIKKALQYKNPTTLQTQAKPLWQFENDLRGDPRWKKTKNAQDSLMQVGHQVLSDFGFKY